MNKENTVLTIDIGGASLKMAEFSVSASGDTVQLERYAITEMSQDLLEVSFADAFAQAFHQTMSENNFVSHGVRVSISSLHAFQRLSKLPPLLGNRTRAAQVVEGEAKLTVPYPLEEVLWDYQLIKHTKEYEVEAEASDEDAENPEEVEKVTETVEELEAFFVAVKDDLATAIATTLLDADMEVLSIEVAPTAMYNAAKANMFGDNSCDMILDMGGRGSNLIIIDGSRVFVRAIPIGGSTITQLIAKEFNIGYNDAEEMKRKHGFVALGGAYEDSDSEVAATISKIARNVMTRLHGEINRSINSWRSMHDGNRPEALFITGGSSIIPYVPHFLNEKLRLEVSFLNTFPVIAIADTVDKQELLEVAHLFPPMIGLAIRHIRTCPIEIALTPKIIQLTRDLQRKKPYFYASACCALLCVLVFYQGLRARTSHDKKLEATASDQINSAEGVARQIKTQMRLLGGVEDSYNFLAGIANDRARWMAVLNELQKYTPSNMWFTQIDGVKEYKDAESEQQQPVMDPSMMDPGMDPSMMDPGMDPSMMDMGPQEAPNEVAWIRLRGHALEMNSRDRVENVFLDQIKKSDLFQKNDRGEVECKHIQLDMTSDKNNVTSFVIYLKLQNTIKQ